MNTGPRTDIVTVAAVTGTAVAVAVSDPARRTIDVHCSNCRHSPYGLILARGATVTDIERAKTRAADYVTERAANCAATALDRGVTS